MKALANLSIRNKLVGIILISTILSVVSGFGFAIRRNIEAFREELTNTTRVIADALSDDSAIFLFFEDEEGAQESLEKASVLPIISDAYLFDKNDALFAAYSRSGEVTLPPKVHQEPHTELLEAHLDHFTPVQRVVEEEVEWLGTLYLRASTDALEARIREDVLYMLGLMLAVVGVAATLAYLLQGVISRPILYLAEMAQRISERADYSIRVKKPGNDEIGILYDGFNEMLGQIQKRQEELERSNRDLDQFAYVASHDLKAPLRAIATLSGWIEEDLKGKLSPEGAEQMRLLRSRVQRMDHLIEGILQYSRAGRLETRGEPVDVGDMLAEIVEILDPPNGLRVIIGSDMPKLVTKRLRLEQVFTNLINNAIKYHDRPDGRVEVTARRDGRFFEFAVRDDGRGIAPEHHEKVFMMFQTLQPRDQVESTGLGLSLVKKLVEEEGGSIHLESDVGQGATFRFTWPAIHEGASSEETQS